MLMMIVACFDAIVLSSGDYSSCQTDAFVEYLLLEAVFRNQTCRSMSFRKLLKCIQFFYILQNTLLFSLERIETSLSTPFLCVWINQGVMHY